MEIGITLGADYVPYDLSIKAVQFAERLGYTQVSVPEIWGHDQVSYIALLMGKTKEIKFSTGIMNMYSRTPALVAMTAASLSQLSGGRFILGLGLSGPKVVEDFHGRKFVKPLRHTRDFVTIVQTLLRFERINYESETLGTLKDFRLSFKPEHDIPIHIAALGPKNMKLTAEIADGWLPVFMTKKGLEESITNMRKHIPAGKKFDITPFILSIKGSDERAKKLLRAHMGYYFGGMGTFYNEMLRRNGFEEEADEIMSRFKKGDVLGAYAAISDEILDATCIYGERVDARNALEEFYRSGATVPLISVPFKTPPDLFMETLEILAPGN